MDDLSTEEMRGKATAACLRRALGAPVEGDLPAIFGAMLRRMGEVEPAQEALQRHPARIGA